MMYSKNQLKLRKGLIVYDLIKKFEENSPMVKSLNEAMLILKKIVIVGMLYFFITCFIQEYVFITLIFVLIVSLSVGFYIIKKYGEILYSNSKHIGRKNAIEYN